MSSNSPAGIHVTLTAETLVPTSASTHGSGDRRSPPDGPRRPVMCPGTLPDRRATSAGAGGHRRPRVLTDAGTSLPSMLVESWLARAAAVRPDRVAIEAPDGQLTYAKLLAAAREHAAGLPQFVEIDAVHGLDFVVRLHACLLAGVTAVPIDPRLGDRERAALGDAPGDLVMHTSGTTGAPQPVGL